MIVSNLQDQNVIELDCDQFYTDHYSGTRSLHIENWKIIPGTLIHMTAFGV